MHKTYGVELEVAGPSALFARADTGATPVSYPVPTWSASKGIFESVAMLASGDAYICPTKVEVCSPVGCSDTSLHFQNYTTNYGGPLRKSDHIKKDNNMQISATILNNVCYRLHGIVFGPVCKTEKSNPRHHLQDLFNRRVQKGQCFRVPCLGQSDFVCTYWGPFRHGVTEVNPNISLEIESMLFTMWDKPSKGNYQPEFYQNVKIVKGTLVYPYERLIRSECNAQ